MPNTSDTVLIANAVGKADYSINVQSSTEPLVSSYQEDFHYAKSIAALGAGSTSTFDIPITSNYLVMMYDFEASANLLEALSMNVSSLVDGVATQIITKAGTEKVTVTLTKGFPFFQNIRIAIRNRSLLALDIDFHCHGVMLSEEQYYLETAANLNQADT